MIRPLFDHPPRCDQDVADLLFGKIHVSLDIISNPWFWAWAIPACILTGISKSGLGGGVGGYTVPLMSMAISPIQAAAIALPVLCVIDIAALRAWWGKWDRTVMRTIMPGGLLGIVLGGFTFSVMNEHWIRVMIGGISIGYLGWNLLKLMNKGVTVEQVARVTRAFTEAGVMVHAYLMYGFPTQTEQETVDALERIDRLLLRQIGRAHV